MVPPTSKNLLQASVLGWTINMVGTFGIIALYKKGKLFPWQVTRCKICRKKHHLCAVAISDIDRAETTTQLIFDICQNEIEEKFGTEASINFQEQVLSYLHARTEPHKQKRWGI